MNLSLPILDSRFVDITNGVRISRYNGPEGIVVNQRYSANSSLIADFTWTPAEAGTYEFLFEVSDYNGYILSPDNSVTSSNESQEVIDSKSGTAVQRLTLTVVDDDDFFISSSPYALLNEFNDNTGSYAGEIKLVKDGKRVGGRSLQSDYTYEVENFIASDGTVMPRGEINFVNNEIRITTDSSRTGLHYFLLKVTSKVDGRVAEQHCVYRVGVDSVDTIVAGTWALVKFERMLNGGARLLGLLQNLNNSALITPWDFALERSGFLDDPNFFPTLETSLDDAIRGRDGADGILEARRIMREYIFDSLYVGEFPLIEVLLRDNSDLKSVYINDTNILVGYELSGSGGSMLPLIDGNRAIGMAGTPQGLLIILQDLLPTAIEQPPVITTLTLNQAGITEHEGDDFGWIPGSSAVTETGDFTYAIPIDAPAGINGMTPSVALEYNSSLKYDANLGHGWKLHASDRIERRKLTYVHDGKATTDIFDDESGFMFKDQPLRKVEYTRTGGNAAQTLSFYVTDEYNGARFTHNEDNDTWKVEYPSGHIETYNTRVRGQESAGGDEGATAWLLDEETDAYSNSISYYYEIGNQHRLDYIEYANNGIIIDFMWDTVPATQQRTAYRDGFPYLTNINKLTNIQVLIATPVLNIYRDYVLDYEDQPSNSALPRKLASVTIHGKASGVDDGPVLDTHTFGYIEQEEGFEEFANGKFTSVPLPVNGVQFYNAETAISGDQPYTEEGTVWYDVDEDGIFDLLKAETLYGNAFGALESLRINRGDVKGWHRVTKDGFGSFQPLDIPVSFVHNTALTNIIFNKGSLHSVKTEIKAIKQDLNGDGREELINHDGKVYTNRGYNNFINGDVDKLWIEDINFKIPDILDDWYTINYLGGFTITEGFSHSFINHDGDNLPDLYVAYTKNPAIWDINQGCTVKVYKNLGKGTGAEGSAWELVFNSDDEGGAYYPFGYLQDTGLSARNNFYWNKINTDKDYFETRFFIPGNLQYSAAKFTFPNGVLADVNGDGITDYIHDVIENLDGSNLSEAQSYFSGSIFIGNAKGGIEIWRDPDTNEIIKLPAGIRLNHYRGFAIIEGVPIGDKGTFPMPLCKFRDINGDSYPEIIYADQSDSNNRAVYVGTGRGWVETSSDYNTDLLTFTDSDNAFDLGVKYKDLDMDGYVDQIKHYKTEISGSTSSSEVIVVHNWGNNWGDVLESDNPGQNIYPISPLAIDVKPTVFRRVLQASYNVAEGMIDFNGYIDPLNLGMMFMPGGESLDAVMPLFVSRSYLMEYIQSSRVHSKSRGQALIDVNGDGSVDDFYVTGNYTLESDAAVTESRVRLNKRDATYQKLNKITTNLDTIDIEYNLLNDPNVCISRANTAIPGGPADAMTANITPLAVVTSVTHDVSGTDRKLDYYYGDYATKGNKMAFGKMWTVDNIAKTMTETHRITMDGNWATFGKVNWHFEFHFDTDLDKIERSDPSVLLNSIDYTRTSNANPWTTTKVEKDSFAGLSWTYSLPVVRQPFNRFVERHFMDNNTQIGTILTELAYINYYPYFIVNRTKSATVDPATNDTITRTTHTPQPTRFNGLKSSTTSVFMANTPDQNRLPSRRFDSLLKRDNIIDFITEDYGTVMTTTTEHSYTHTITDTIWQPNRIDRDTITKDNRLDNKESIIAHSYDPDGNGGIWKPSRVTHYGDDVTENDGRSKRFTYYANGLLSYVVEGRKSNVDIGSCGDCDDDRLTNTLITYTGSGGRFMKSVTSTGIAQDADGNRVSGSRKTLFSEHNLFTGQPGRTDHSNGLVSIVHFDDYDRPSVVYHPTPEGETALITQTTVREFVGTGQRPNDDIAYVVRTASSGPMYHYTGFDNAHRPVKSWWPSSTWEGGEPDNKWNQILTSYNDNGTLNKVTKPIAYGSSSNSINSANLDTEHKYDAYTRPHYTIHRGIEGPRITYDLNTVTATDSRRSPVIKKTSTTHFGMGTSTVTFDRENNQDVERLVVELYDVNGKTLAIRTDADGKNAGIFQLQKDTAIFMTYDIFGNRKSLDDPSFGIHGYTYNIFNEPTLVEKNPDTPDETLIEYHRDWKGRPTLVKYSGKRQNVTMESRLEKYTYDVSLLDSTDRFNDYLFATQLNIQDVGDDTGTGTPHHAVYYTPDKWGATVDTLTSIGVFNDNDVVADIYQFKSSQTYDGLRRPKRTYYPKRFFNLTVPGLGNSNDAYYVDRGYSKDQRLEKLTDKEGVVLWEAVEVNREGFLEEEHMGVGEIGNGDTLRIQHTPDDFQRLERTVATRINSAGTSRETYLNSAYSYYDDHNMESRTFNFIGNASDGLVDRTVETFNYDPLDQLTSSTHWRGTGDGTSGTIQRKPLNYVYDAHSRMTSKDRIKSAFETETLYFTYPEIE